MADPTSPVELDALLPGVRRLAPGAFHDLYELMADSLNAFAHSMLRDRSAAEDVVQQAFLELVTGATEIRGDGRSLRSWLYRSVRFGCLDELRRRSRKPASALGKVAEELNPVLDEPDLGLDPELATALAELTPQQRSALYLRHVVGMSGREAARVMGATRAAVFATTSRAERRLRTLLETSDEA